MIAISNADESGKHLVPHARMARELSCDPKTLSRWDREGLIGPKPTRMNGRKMWDRSAVVAWFGAGCPDRTTWEQRPENGQIGA